MLRGDHDEDPGQVNCPTHYYHSHPLLSQGIIASGHCYDYIIPGTLVA